ncbi:MAG: hypothetical protein K6T30_06625 [Alicyclobacillus sp.]|nr:hypothetical protein [Alicyclobacillus sp.]
MSKHRLRDGWFVGTAVLAVITGVFTAASCVPFWGQAQCILITWFLAAVGGAASLCLNVWKHPWAMRLLALYVVCMALSFVAAVAKVLIAG